MKPDKRRSPRFPARLMIRYGDEKRSHAARTGDISAEGMRIRGTWRVNPGAQVHGQITLAKDTTIQFTGKVRWVRRVQEKIGYPPAVYAGVKFNEPPDPVYFGYLRTLEAGFRPDQF